MPLEVKVISYQGRPPENRLNANFTRDGGTIGRSTGRSDNHLSLPDPERYISRKHALIEYKNGHYTLTDTSVDGTFVNNRNQRVHRQTVTLADGDQIWIGEYELRVHIFSNGAHETAADDLFNFNGERASFSDMDQGNRARTVSPGNLAGSETNSDWWPENGFLEKSAEPSEILIDQPQESPLRDAFSPPDIVEDPIHSRAIPKDFNFEQLLQGMDEPQGNHITPEAIKASEPEPPRDPETPGNGFEAPFLSEPEDLSASTRKTQDGAVSTAGKSPDIGPSSVSATGEPLRQQARLELLRIFLDAAGVKETTLPDPSDMPKMMASMGTVFREMVDGLMAVLRGRTELKTQLRVQATRIKPADNNPLKFFSELDEALKQLLVSDQPGFVDAPSAVREAFADIINHQMAMTAGLQAALINLIKQFDPQGFAKPYEEGVVFQKKAKSWDAYQQAYTKIANEALDDFFGKAFAEAYEAQIRKLQSKP